MKGEMVTAQHLQAGELEIIDNNGVSISATELLTAIKTGRIPLYDPPRMDERRFCVHAIDGDEALAAGCNCLIREGKTTWCSLNGREAKSPCVFDETLDAPVWAEILAYRLRWGNE